MWQSLFHHQRQEADKGKTQWSTALPVRRETNKIDLVNNNSGASGYLMPLAMLYFWFGHFSFILLLLCVRCNLLSTAPSSSIFLPSCSNQKNLLQASGCVQAGNLATEIIIK